MSRAVDLGLWAALAACLVFFYLPIFTLLAYSFNTGQFLSVPFAGLGLDWYRALLDDALAGRALFNTTLIALATTLASTALGTAAIIALWRYRFRGRTLLMGLSGAPVVFPQMLLGIVLLLWFSQILRWLDTDLGLVRLHMGVWTAVLGHIIYITPFVMVIVAVQLSSFDPTLEDAAADAGASPWQIWRHVTIPLLWPGIFSGAIFAFLLSWGNFYLTYNLAGTTETLPTYVFARVATGSSPLLAALGAAVFLPGLILAFAAGLLLRRARHGA